MALLFTQRCLTKYISCWLIGKFSCREELTNRAFSKSKFIVKKKEVSSTKVLLCGSLAALSLRLPSRTLSRAGTRPVTLPKMTLSKEKGRYQSAPYHRLAQWLYQTKRDQRTRAPTKIISKNWNTSHKRPRLDQEGLSAASHRLKEQRSTRYLTAKHNLFL